MYNVHVHVYRVLPASSHNRNPTHPLALHVGIGKGRQKVMHYMYVSQGNTSQWMHKSHTSGDESHLHGVSLRESHKISLKAQRHGARATSVDLSLARVVQHSPFQLYDLAAILDRSYHIPLISAHAY